MKKVSISFEYNIPEKKESYSIDKKDLIRNLVYEKKKMKEYLVSKQEEINKAIDDLVVGSNITEAENFLSEVLGSKDKDKKFRFIGTSNQDKINEIYMSYREVIKGMNTFEIMSENNMFTKEEKDEVLHSNIKKDLLETNEILKKNGIDFTLKLKNLMKDKDYYEKDIVDILMKIKETVALKVIA